MSNVWTHSLVLVDIASAKADQRYPIQNESRGETTFRRSSNEKLSSFSIKSEGFNQRLKAERQGTTTKQTDVT